MRLLTYAFIALVMPLAAVTRRQPGARRALWARRCRSSPSRASPEPAASRRCVVAGGAARHHASLPLAFAILYQDFPFALADLFLKRALTLVALVSAALLGVAAIGAIHSLELPLRDPRDVGLLVTLWSPPRCSIPGSATSSAGSSTPFCSIAPTTRRFGPTSPGRAAAPGHRRDAGRRVRAAGARSERADGRLARAAGAAPARDRRDHACRTVAATVDVPVAEPPHYALEISGLFGGRRLLSDDHRRWTRSPLSPAAASTPSG